MSRQKVHLPDCTRVRSIFREDCDCGMPPHPLPANKKLVHKYNRQQRRWRWRVETKKGFSKP